jgi:hypothetical protein
MHTNVTTTQANGGDLVQLDPEAFAGRLAQFAEAEQARSWTGHLLRFNRGKYVIGKDENETVVPIGTRLTAALDSVEVGWERWDDGVLTSSKTGFMIAGYVRPERDELGDNDPALWSIDKTSGKPRDPWTKVSRIILYKTKGDRDTVYTFVSRSHGGIQTIADLCKQAGKTMRMYPSAWPVVALKASSYKHTKLNTRVDIPILELVDWDDDRWTGAAIRKEA